jgi:hypothetical protein
LYDWKTLFPTRKLIFPDFIGSRMIRPFGYWRNKDESKERTDHQGRTNYCKLELSSVKEDWAEDVKTNSGQGQMPVDVVRCNV